VLAFPLGVPERPRLGVLSLYAESVGAFTEAEVLLLAELAGDLGYGLEALRAADQRNAAEQRAADYSARLAALATTIEKRDPYTAGHQRRVAHLAVEIGRRLGLSEQQVEGLMMGGLVHDVGKIYVPSEILNRPGMLSSYEMEVIRAHPDVGREIIAGIDFPWPVADMVHNHHERLDGSGYPRGLKGDAIDLAARILAVADVVEAMSSHRPHRPSRGIDAALQEIRAHAGTRYDLRVVDACEKLFREEGFQFPA
jgi:putative nucleotidyltransferase with HDIG domain